jgi:hypothetical protein
MMLRQLNKNRTHSRASLQPHYFLRVRVRTMIWSLFITVALSACGRLAPANTPPHLDYTPGPAAVITDETYDAGAFSVRYPLGWQVITPAAFSTPWVVFVNPEDTALIVLALDIADTRVTPSNEENELDRREETLQLDNGETLFAVLVAPREKWEDYEVIFERVVASVGG